MDFMCESLQYGRRVRTFNLVDDFNREALAIEIDLNLPSQRVYVCWNALSRGGVTPPNYAWIMAVNSVIMILLQRS
ncbi:hypothetical protein GCM10007391_07840 [Alteromonas halophila]|uniref:Transposase n=1 Tax=Alteromonas halophila TaxID=516698 RepID=A0A918MWZ9_9ALTE|nr:hypothetical protein GCM10007391_07840 [Alteromonas halophila]